MTGDEPTDATLGWCGVEDVHDPHGWQGDGTRGSVHGKAYWCQGRTADPVLEQRVARQGRLAYYAYGKMTDGKSAVTGAALPDWHNTTAAVRHAWIEAARAVRADTLDPDWAHRTGADHSTAPWNRNTPGGAH